MLLLAHVLLGLALAGGGPAAASQPVVTGTLQQGSRLAGSPGTWVGTGTITYAYQWYRCDPRGAHCRSIHGATGGGYRLGAKDAGQTIGLTVSATDPTGTAAAYSALAGPIAPPGTLAATRQPALSGAPLVGGTLTVAPAVWTAAPGPLSYAWLRCNGNGRLCAPIAGAAGSAYRPAAADAGHVVLAAVTTQGQTVLSLSPGAVRTAPGPVAAGRPAIAGTLQQGQKLAAAAGAWSGTGTISYTYQWYRCDVRGAHCGSIRGATSPRYTEVAKDVGRTLALTVRATDATGTTEAYSSLAGPVAPAGGPAVTSQPSLAGTATVGGTLTVTGGTWTQPPGPPAYAWLRCNASGRLCSPIAGAAAAAYTLTAADSGYTVVASVTAGGRAVLSTASAVVP